MKKNREQTAYEQGLAKALDLVKVGGVKLLEDEIKFRNIHSVPPNISKDTIVELARAHSKNELLFVATASASTIVEDLKLPPSSTLKYLKGFNDRVALFRTDTEAFNAAVDRLDRLNGMQMVCKQFMEEK